MNEAMNTETMKTMILMSAVAGVEAFRNDPLARTVAGLVWKQGLKTVISPKAEAEEFDKQKLYLVANLDPATGALEMRLVSKDEAVTDALKKVVKTKDLPSVIRDAALEIVKERTGEQK